MWFVTDDDVVIYGGDEGTAHEIFSRRHNTLKPEYRNRIKIWRGEDVGDEVGVISTPRPTTAKTAPGIPEVSIGDGATMRVGSDAYPFTVVGVTPRTIRIKRDHYQIIAGGFQSGDAVIQYTTNHDAPSIVARWSQRKGRQKGYYTAGGNRITVGVRRYYQDPSY